MKNGMHRTAADFKLVHLNMTCKQGWCSRLSLSAAFMQLPRETWSCEPCSQSYWVLCLMKVCPRDPRACEFAHVSVTLFSLSARSGWCAHDLWSCKSVLKINISRILSSHYVHAFAIWKHLQNNTSGCVYQDLSSLLQPCSLLTQWPQKPREALWHREYFSINSCPLFCHRLLLHI